MWRRRRKQQEPADAYLGLRGLVLGLDPAESGMAPSERLPAVWGGMMEMGLGEATVTIVCLADGTTSLYTSVGGGILGSGEHESVASRAIDFLAAFEQHRAALAPEDEPALPPPGSVCLRALLYGGGRVAATLPKDLLGRGDHELSPLFFAGHEVITAVRVLEEQQQRQSGS